MSNSTSSSKYINLITQGIGRVKRIRDVTPRKGDPFLCCDIIAICGESEKPSEQRFDLKVTGSDAAHLIRKCEKAVMRDGSDVVVSFRVGDLWVDLFTYTKGDRAGKPGTSLKGRLLWIEWINIDGVRVYTATSNSHDEAPNTEFPPDAVPAPRLPRSAANEDRTDSPEMAASF
jgi:hypothetical protein